MDSEPLILTSQEATRLINNFYNQSGLEADHSRIALDSHLLNYFSQHSLEMKQKVKVAFLWICLNPLYWQYAKPMLEGARQFFLPGQTVDYFVWSDMPEIGSPELQTILNTIPAQAEMDIMVQKGEDTRHLISKERLLQIVEQTRKEFGDHIFYTEAIEWPMPTLMRYHLFLQQEELLKNYDYIFYCDVDMKFVNVVGDEILCDGITASQNPMYVLDKSMWPPYEPNPQSAAYISRPGIIMDDNGQPRFMPCYYAGGFQGGKSDAYIDAMKGCKDIIDHDMHRINYIPIWNEESAWNKYLLDHPPLKVLTPSYIYPDSLHNEYYIPRWGRNYLPKLVTLTKSHTLKPLTSEDQANLIKMRQK